MMATIWRTTSHWAVLLTSRWTFMVRVVHSQAHQTMENPARNQRMLKRSGVRVMAIEKTTTAATMIRS